VIYQLIGKEKVQVNLTLDYQNKKTGSIVENPNWAGAAYSLGELLKPNEFSSEVIQERYNSLYSLDNKLVNVVTTNTTNQIACLGFRIGVYEEFKRILGDTFFNDRGATTVSECMDVVRSIVKEFSYNVFGYGTGPSGNSLNTTIWNGGGAWSSGVFGNKTNTVSKISRKMTSRQEIEGFLNSDGNASIIAYSKKTDGATKSAINVDYVSLDFTIEISANEHIKSMMAAY
ncbi:hypothetical protein ABQE10_21675, partial [Enterococcus avium]